MLGIDAPQELIQGKFAKEIREAMQRMSTGKLNGTDKDKIQRSRNILKQFDAVWK